jgi:glycosyltransferase involved in cell wall biosynthesis
MTTFQSDLICFSHLRWTFVFQRPQHLMSRFARHNRVYFVEEPIFGTQREAELKCSVCAQSGVRVITPVLPRASEKDSKAPVLRKLIQKFVQQEDICDFAAWYYTPMAMGFTEELTPELTVYDCMDELSAFANAPADMRRNEQMLFERCDLVFTGGQSLFEAKRLKHERVHLFPSSVDTAHFARALTIQKQPEDQRDIPRPRVGYAGVIDERMDLQLIECIAEKRPEWQIVLVGPVVKIDPESLPRRRNIHYTGMKSYDELPAYLAGWDVAMLPFAQNEATRFISPTKTPEYLAAGLPVVSTPIQDVVRPYGELGLVTIGRDHEQFVGGIEQQLGNRGSATRQSEVKKFLSLQSWDKTWDSMQRVMAQELARKKRATESAAEEHKGIVFTPQVSAARV